MEYLLEQSIYFKNLWLTDVFNAREAINNKEQDPEAIQDRNQQEAMRDYLGANIDPINVAPFPVYEGTTQRQRRVLEFFPAKRQRTE